MALKLKAVNKVGKLKCTYGRILLRKNIEKVGRKEASLCLPPSSRLLPSDKPSQIYIEAPPVHTTARATFGIQYIYTRHESHVNNHQLKQHKIFIE
jgi:hypothetical protein